MGWGLAAYGLMSYLSSKDQANAARESSQPLPTYYQEYQSPQQAQMYGQMLPSIQNMYGGNMPSPTLANIGQAPTPSAGWYSGLDSNVRAGIEEPYMRGMDMMRTQLGGTGMLGNQRSGMSGAAADVFGQYMQQAAPAMAQTGWNMMQPGMLQQLGAQNQAGLMGQQQGWESQMMPYQALPSMLPQTYSDLLVGHHPTIQQMQPGAPMSPEYMTQMQNLQAQLALLQNQSIVPQDFGGNGNPAADPIDRLGIYGDPAAGWGDYGLGDDSGPDRGGRTGSYGGEGGGYGW